MELRFQTAGDEWVRGLCGDLSAQVKILGLKYVDRGNEVAHFVDIVVGAEAPGGVREWLGSSPAVTSAELTDLSKQHMVGVVTASRCRACSSIMSYDSALFISSAATGADCSVGYKVFLSDEGVPPLLRRLTRDRIGYRVNEISPISPDLKLSERQLGVLKSAMEMGLYDFPRRITQDELAAKLGIKTSTLNEILRRGQKKILGSFLSDLGEM